MADMSSRKRKQLKSSQFALPKTRQYPVNDRAHAANAKARATQQYERGNLSAAQRAQVNRKANAVLKRKGK